MRLGSEKLFPWSFWFMLWPSAWQIQRFECIGSHRGPERPRAYQFKCMPIYGYISSLKTWTILHNESRAWGVDLLRKTNDRWEAGLVNLTQESQMPLTFCAFKLSNPRELSSCTIHYFSIFEQDGPKCRLFLGQSQKHLTSQHVFFMIQQCPGLWIEIKMYEKGAVLKKLWV